MASPSPRYTLLTAARLLDGSGGAAVGQAALRIDGDRVAGLGRAADVHAPDGATVERRDYGAATILPGLVDAHTHLVAPGDGTLGDDIAKEDDDILLVQAAKNARTLLHAGVTTLRENGAKGKVAFPLREGIRRRLAPGPRMVVCGRPITITGGHMGYFGSEADGEAAVRAEVRTLLKEGADYIKIVASGGSTRTSDPNRASYTVAELAAMTDEAHPHGKLTAAPCTSAPSAPDRRDARRHVIQLPAQAGLSYSDAIVAGTAGAAQSIGVGPAAGRLAKGRPADALVVRGDPTAEITALWDVLDVYQAGRRVERGVL